MSLIAQEYTQLQILESLKRSKSSLPASNATIDVTSTRIVIYNKNRRSLMLTNTGTFPIFLAINEPAVANKGMYLLNGGGMWEMDSFTYTNGSVFGIAIGGASNVAIQEFE